MKFLTILIAILLAMNSYGVVMAENDQNSEQSTLIHKWQESPVIPTGWEEIDRLVTKISNDNYNDIFSIITDGKNDLILWFENNENVWKMVILSTVPTEKHLAYGAKTKDLKIFVKDTCVMYGIEGSEAISIFKWDPRGRTFLEYLPPYM